MFALRVVENACAVVAFDEASDRADAQRALRAEAAAFAAVNGANPYSDFVLKHGRRPAPQHAAILGRLIGRQVKAADGTLQPRRSRAQREACKLEREARQAERRRLKDTTRVWAAIKALAEAGINPSELLGGTHYPCRPIDESDTSDQLKAASGFLNRILREVDSVQAADRTLRPTDSRCP